MGSFGGPSTVPANSSSHRTSSWTGREGYFPNFHLGILSHLAVPAIPTYFSFFLYLRHILRVIHQHCKFSISHFARHCAIPTRLSRGERLITCSPWRGEQPLSYLKYPVIITVLSLQPGKRFNQTLNTRNDGK